MKSNDTKNMKSSMLRGNAGLLVLLILSEAPAAGHVVAGEVSRRSQNLIDFGEGSIYPILHELQGRGLVDSEWQVRDGKRPVRVYRLTDEGATELEHRLQVWTDFSTAMDLVIRGRRQSEQSS